MYYILIEFHVPMKLVVSYSTPTHVNVYTSSSGSLLLCKLKLPNLYIYCATGGQM